MIIFCVFELSLASLENNLLRDRLETIKRELFEVTYKITLLYYLLPRMQEGRNGNKKMIE